MSDMQLLLASCHTSESFPENIVRSSTSRHHLKDLCQQLNEHKDQLLCEDGKASLDLWEYYDGCGEFQNACISSTFELKGRLEGDQLFAHEDPRSRFIFIHAPHSRERLRVSYEMLISALTYHQVMPNFLDFIFPFGYQHYAKDFHSMSFQEDTRLSMPGGALDIPELGRSGQEIRICYNLKSVEPHRQTSDWPWSVRQAALYHSFDVVTGKACWVIVKGNNLIRDRIRSATSSTSQDASELCSYKTTASSFASALATHLILYEWCNEYWRRYLNFLQKKFQDLSRRVLSADVPKAPSFVEPSTFHIAEPPITLSRTSSELIEKASTMPRRIGTLGSVAMATKNEPSFLQLSSPPEPHLDKGESQLPPVLPPGTGRKHPPNSANMDEIYSAETLYRVQTIKEKANEVLFSVEANIKIITNIKNHYESILTSENCPPDLVFGCKSEFAHFQKCIENILGDLEMQHTSARILLRLIEGREGLLSRLSNLRSIPKSVQKFSEEDGNDD